MKKIYRFAELNAFKEELYSWRDHWGQHIVLSGIHAQPLHFGHVQLIRDCRKFGDMVVIALNSDESSIRKSGYSFLPWEHRAAILAEFQCVDFVLENPYNSMEEIIRIIKPKAYCKGGGINKSNVNPSELQACYDVGCEFLSNVGGATKIASSRDFLNDYISWFERNRTGKI